MKSPKSLAIAILEKKKPEGGDEEPEAEGGDTPGLDAAAADIMAAVKAGDTGGLKAALQDFMTMCGK